MIIAWYYIGMILGIAVVLFCNFAARWATGAKRDSMCDRCKNLAWKGWSGRYTCRWRSRKYFFPPKYCSDYKERMFNND